MCCYEKQHSHSSSWKKSFLGGPAANIGGKGQCEERWKEAPFTFLREAERWRGMGGQLGSCCTPGLSALPMRPFWQKCWWCLQCSRHHLAARIQLLTDSVISCGLSGFYNTWHSWRIRWQVSGAPLIHNRQSVGSYFHSLMWIPTAILPIQIPASSCSQAKCTLKYYAMEVY